MELYLNLPDIFQFFTQPVRCKWQSGNTCKILFSKDILVVRKLNREHKLLKELNGTPTFLVEILIGIHLLKTCDNSDYLSN